MILWNRQLIATIIRTKVVKAPVATMLQYHHRRRKLS